MCRVIKKPKISVVLSLIFVSKLNLVYFITFMRIIVINNKEGLRVMYVFIPLATADWLFNKSQLLPLGITERHIHFLIGFVSILSCYFLLRPCLRWLVALNWDKLLTYVMSSICILFLLCLFTILGDVKGEDIGLQRIAGGTLGIIFFGGVLGIIHLTQSIITYFKQQKSTNL